MALYLVTGGAGFIGSHIVEALVGRGHQVRVLDNLMSGKKENLAGLLDRIEFMEADFRDLKTCRRAVAGVDYVLHQGALVSVPLSVDNPVLVNEINITGTLNILVSARDEGVRGVVLASSSAVYGDDPALPKTEAMKTSPLSPYALTKLINEYYGILFYKLYGLRTVSLRYFNVFGPRQDPASPYAAVIPIFIARILRGEKPVIYGDGEQSRDFVYVANVVEANILATEAEGAGGDVFNIAEGRSISINSLLAMINEIVGTDIRADYQPPRPGDVRHSLADIKKARLGLGYELRTSFFEGLKKTIEWHIGIGGSEK